MGFLEANNVATLLLDGERATKTNLDRIGSLKVNNLATLVLDCERATKKGSESHGFLEGETVFRPRVLPTVAITRTEIWFERSAVEKNVKCVSNGRSCVQKICPH